MDDHLPDRDWTTGAGADQEVHWHPVVPGQGEGTWDLPQPVEVIIGGTGLSSTTSRTKTGHRFHN